MTDHTITVCHEPAGDQFIVAASCRCGWQTEVTRYWLRYALSEAATEVRNHLLHPESFQPAPIIDALVKGDTNK